MTDWASFESVLREITDLLEQFEKSWEAASLSSTFRKALAASSDPTRRPPELEEMREAIRGMGGLADLSLERPDGSYDFDARIRLDDLSDQLSRLASQ